MDLRSIAAGFLLIISSAFAQLDSNSITVTASRNTTPAPDLASITIDVTADPSATLSDVLASVQSLGLTISDLASVEGTTINQQNALDWSFSLNAAIASLKTTTSALTKLQGTVSLNNSLILSINFYVGGTSISPQAQQSQSCPVSGLIADARAKAAALAAAAGRTLSGVLAVSGSTVPFDSPAPVSSSASPNCSVTVKFGLLGS